MYKNANTFMLPTKMDNNLDAAKTNCFPVYSAIYVTKKKKSVIQKTIIIHFQTAKHYGNIFSLL